MLDSILNMYAQKFQKVNYFWVLSVFEHQVTSVKIWIKYKMFQFPLVLLIEYKIIRMVFLIS